MAKEDLTLRAQVKRLYSERKCFVCLESVPEANGGYRGELRIFAHEGACYQAVREAWIAHDRSPRGRMRPRREVWHRLAIARRREVTEGGVPVIEAVEIGDPKNKEWRFWCVYCDGHHFHGAVEGHRVAHCISRGSPYLGTGYILRKAARRSGPSPG